MYAGAAQTSVVGVETVVELESILSGVDAGIFTDKDEFYLAPYLQHHEDLSQLVRNGLKHSPEIQARIITHLRQNGIDYGDSLETYLQTDFTLVGGA